MAEKFSKHIPQIQFRHSIISTEFQSPIAVVVGTEDVIGRTEDGDRRVYPAKTAENTTVCDLNLASAPRGYLHTGEQAVRPMHVKVVR